MALVHCIPFPLSFLRGTSAHESVEQDIWVSIIIIFNAVFNMFSRVAWWLWDSPGEEDLPPFSESR